VQVRPTGFFQADALDWQVVDVRGTPMHEARVMDGEHGVYSAFYRLPKGMVIRPHLHRGWVQVLVLTGEMEVTDDGGVQRVGAGGCYVVSPGRRHEEQAVDDTVVLVTGVEP
jgi:quercetin dioxygenase-like cupin family protein